MQASEVSGFAVRRLSGNGAKFRRTLGRTVAGQLSIFFIKNSHIKLSGQVSGTVRLVANVRCLSGGVSLGHAAPDTRPDRQLLEVTQ